MQYDRDNEAQFRRSVEQLLQQVVSATNDTANNLSTVTSTLAFFPDNTIDVGDIATPLRPKTVYAATSVVTPLLRAVTGQLSGNLTVGGTASITGATVLQSSSLTINGLAYTWPGSQTANRVLRNTGPGTLAWSQVDLTTDITGIIPSANVSGAYSGITGVGTLASGAVPASLVTAGTFGAGAYVFPGTLDIASTLTVQTDTTLTANALSILNGAGNTFLGDRYSDTAAAAATFALSHAGGSKASPTASLSGFALAIYRARGWNGSAFVTASEVNTVAVETFSASPLRRAASVQIKTNSRLGGTGAVVRWTFDADGDLLAGDAVAGSGDNAYSLGNASQRIKDIYYGGQLVSSIATGTAPFSVASTTKVSNLNADLLDDQSGSYYLDLANATGTLDETLGGTGLTSYTLGDILYASASNTLSKLAGNTSTTGMYLKQTGNGTISAAPVWDTLTAADVGAGTFSGGFTFASSVVFNAAIQVGSVRLNATTNQIDTVSGNLTLTADNIGNAVRVLGSGSAKVGAVRLSGDNAVGTGAYLDLYGTSHANAGRIDLVSGGSADLNLTAGSGLVKCTTDFQVASGKVYKVNGTQVVQARITGYTNAMTGTADRATAYATSTITLQQLAERVKALEDDLTTHGLIGV